MKKSEKLTTSQTTLEKKISDINNCKKDYHM